MEKLKLGYEAMYPLSMYGVDEVLDRFRSAFGVEVAQYRQDGGGMFVSEASGYWPLSFEPGSDDESIRIESAEMLGCKESDILIKYEDGKRWARRWEK